MAELLKKIRNKMFNKRKISSSNTQPNLLKKQLKEKNTRKGGI